MVACSAETSAEPSLQAKQLQLKRARLADDLNDKISHRPGPIELVHKNILSVDCPVHSPLGNRPSVYVTSHRWNKYRHHSWFSGNQTSALVSKHTLYKKLWLNSR